MQTECKREMDEYQTGNDREWNGFKTRTKRQWNGFHTRIDREWDGFETGINRDWNGNESIYHRDNIGNKTGNESCRKENQMKPGKDEYEEFFTIEIYQTTRERHMISMNVLADVFHMINHLVSFKRTC